MGFVINVCVYYSEIRMQMNDLMSLAIWIEWYLRNEQRTSRFNVDIIGTTIVLY